MKKLLSVLAVAAIVTSAFAFTNKVGPQTFCIRNAAGNGCAFVTATKDVGLPFLHYPKPAWNGTVAACNAAGVNLCSVNILLDINQ